MIVDHGLAAHLQRERVALAGEVGELQRVLSFDGFHGRSGGDAAGQGNLAGPRRGAALAPLLNILGRNFERPALIEEAAQVIARLKRLNVLVHGGERSQMETLGEFLVAGAVAVSSTKSAMKSSTSFCRLVKAMHLL